MGEFLKMLAQAAASIFGVFAIVGTAVLATNPRAFRILPVLIEVRGLLAKPENDFTLSDWPNGEAALAEMDDHIAKLRGGGTDGIDRLRLLFAPTGPLQEVSIAGGWGERYLELAAQFDSAIRGLAS